MRRKPPPLLFFCFNKLNTRKRERERERTRGKMSECVRKRIENRRKKIHKE